MTWLDAAKAAIKGTDDAAEIGTLIKSFNKSDLSLIFKSFNPTDYANIMKKLDADTLAHFTKNIEPDVLADILKNVDDAQFRAIADTLDTTMKNAIGALDGVLGARLLGVVPNAGWAKLGVPMEALEATLAKNAKVVNGLESFISNPNIAKGVDFPPGKALSDAPTVTAKGEVFKITFDGISLEGSLTDLARVTGRSSDELASLAGDCADLAESVPGIAAAAKKLGMVPLEMLGEAAVFTRKHWMKIGACMVLLCMMYNTKNPFTALSRALEDIDDFVDGLKDIADSAAGAARAAASGGFDLIAFLTQNWWISLLCCFAVIVIGITSTLGVK